LTRERGKNSPLRDALFGLKSVACEELPCVTSVDGPDLGALEDALVTRRWSWVIVTSPEAASVLCNSWQSAGSPALRVAAVGAATATALRQRGLPVAFVPTKATGKALTEEFSEAAKPGEAVLYPASALASGEIQSGLCAKGYEVVRLNTYSTEPADWNSEQLKVASSVSIVTFAAPSAVKGWVRNAGVCDDLRVACIGETSSSAAIAAGFAPSKVFAPSKPGIKGWVNAVVCALDDISQHDG
jgi:uroporphyrinogen-III synthase